MHTQLLRRRAGHAALGVAFAAFLGGAWAQAQPPVTDWTSLMLPAPAGIVRWSASGMNNLGQVIGVGFTQYGPPEIAPVFYDGIMSRTLPTPADTRSTQAVAINDAGQILVENRAVEEGPPYASGSRSSITLHSGGVMTEIMPAGMRDAKAVDLNNRGEVLMSGNMSNGYVSAVTGPSGTRYLAATGIEALDLNNNGVVLYRNGFSQDSPPHLDDHGTVTRLGPADRTVHVWRLSDRDDVWGTMDGILAGVISSFVGGVATPLPGSPLGSVGDVNDRGDVLMKLWDHPRTAFLYRDGVLTDLGVGIAGLTAVHGVSVNNAGQVLFTGELDWGARRYLYFWDNGTVTNLTEVLYREAGGAAALYGIGGVWLNDAGQVLFSSAGAELGPLLLSPVPEPGMLGLTLAGLFALFCTRRRSAGPAAAARPC